MATYVQGRTGEYIQRPLAPKESPPSPVSLLWDLKDKGNLDDDNESMLRNLGAEYEMDQDLEVQVSR